jgi:hypothetical protein
MRTGCWASRGGAHWSVSRGHGGFAVGYWVPWARLTGAKGQWLKFAAASGGPAPVVARNRVSYLDSGIAL